MHPNPPWQGHPQPCPGGPGPRSPGNVRLQPHLLPGAQGPAEQLRRRIGARRNGRDCRPCRIVNRRCGQAGKRIPLVRRSTYSHAGIERRSLAVGTCAAGGDWVANPACGKNCFSGRPAAGKQAGLQRARKPVCTDCRFPGDTYKPAVRTAHRSTAGINRPHHDLSLGSGSRIRIWRNRPVLGEQPHEDVGLTGTTPSIHP